MARMMHHMTVGRYGQMNRLPVLVAAVALAAFPTTSGACRWYGTQLQCDVGGRRLVIGTQTAEAPGAFFPVRALNGARGLPVRAAVASASRLQIHLQDFSDDPARCHRIGNETYCY
jgi:hypothetical protein